MKDNMFGSAYQSPSKPVEEEIKPSIITLTFYWDKELMNTNIVDIPKDKEKIEVMVRKLRSIAAKMYKDLVLDGKEDA